MSNQPKNDPPVVADNPIQRLVEDDLGRAKPAKSFAKHVLALDARKGATVGLFGPWGSGKTSFLNLARSEFEAGQVIVLDFNPWLFSNTEHLVGSFFDALSDHLPVNDGKDRLYKTVKKYGAAITGASGLFGIPFLKEGISALLAAAQSATDQSESVTQLRDQIIKALDKRKEKIVVILDDVDRLSPSEILDILKLVRLTGCFPYLIYIVACDRSQVEKALNNKDYEGRNYLDKIVQWPYNLPEIPAHKLGELVKVEIKCVLKGLGDAVPLDADVWDFACEWIVRPLLTTMRDVRRYANAVWQTAVDLNGQVELADVFCLEAVRLFLPDVFNRLPSAIYALTGSAESSQLAQQSEGGPGSQIEKIVGASASANAERVTQALIYCLFPSARQLLPADIRNVLQNFASLPRRQKERCASKGYIFRYYLERVVNEDMVVLGRAERGLNFMHDFGKFGDFINGISYDDLVNFLTKLNSLGGRFKSQHVEAGTVVFLQILDGVTTKLGSQKRHPYKQVVMSLIRHLIGIEKSSENVKSLYDKLVQNNISLSTRVDWFGQLSSIQLDESKPSFGGSLDETRKALCQEMAQMSVDEMLEAGMVGNILLFAVDNNSSESLLQTVRDVDSPNLTYMILQDITYILSSSGQPSRGTLVNLVKVYGDIEFLREKLNQVKSAFERRRAWTGDLNMPFSDAQRLVDSIVDELEAN